MDWTTRLSFNVLVGVATHLCMRAYEPVSIRKTICALVLIPIPLIRTYNSSSGKLHLAETYFTFILALLSSMVLYRLSPFHPLSNVPGPLINKITRLPLAYQSYLGKNHKYYKRLHDKYGRVVRTAPNEISVNDSYYVPDVLGNSGLPKGPIWEARRLTPAKNRNDDNYLIGVRSLQRHAQLRKPWNRAFGAGPMKDYEAIMLRRAEQLVEHLQDACSANTVVDIARWVNFFAFDVMGDMILGAGFELMRDEDKDGLWKGMETAQVYPWVVGQIPWLSRIASRFPGFGKETRKFGMFCIANAQRRFNNDVEKDLFQHLLNSIRMDSATDDAYALIIPNVVMATLAGADTTASVLSGIIYYLLRYPEYLKRLQHEVEETFPQHRTAPIDTTKLAKMQLLNGIINEGLRLQPAVPTALQRAPLIGGGGRMVGDVFIPEGTSVTVAPYCLHRNPTHFSPRPDDFWPERWYGADYNSKVPGYALDTSAFIAFSYGPAGCAGKPMALLELRYMVTTLVGKFEMAFAPGYNPDHWDRDLKDRFNMVKGALPVEISLRK
ncbi:hypothetical protein D9619_009153 [Psilocybe cf. subviscida]|uniref:Cytochrome P450 n=1 Tax=Psilocybe cf. subviscida TaxID=2480587 RepID=A0A8H5FAY5_9AGAR|nr:hypothetical protein D9619_009153 [Psilocybe cf. subviscida]